MYKSGLNPIVRRRAGEAEKATPAIVVRKSNPKDQGINATSARPVLRNAQELQNYLLKKAGLPLPDKNGKKRKKRKKKADAMHIALLVPRIG